MDNPALDNGRYFYQYNDPKHKAHKVRFCLLYNVLDVMEVTPYSLVINSIEYMWDDLSKKVQH